MRTAKKKFALANSDAIRGKNTGTVHGVRRANEDGTFLVDEHGHPLRRRTLTQEELRTNFERLGYMRPVPWGRRIEPLTYPCTDRADEWAASTQQIVAERMKARVARRHSGLGASYVYPGAPSDYGSSSSSSCDSGSSSFSCD